MVNFWLFSFLHLSASPCPCLRTFCSLSVCPLSLYLCSTLCFYIFLGLLKVCVSLSCLTHCLSVFKSERFSKSPQSLSESELSHSLSNPVSLSLFCLSLASNVSGCESPSLSPSVRLYLGITPHSWSGPPSYPGLRLPSSPRLSSGLLSASLHL